MRILETALYAEDLEAAHAFYVGKLGLEPILFDPDRDLFLRVGSSVLIVFRASKTREPGQIVPSHGAVGPGHMAFGVSHEELEVWDSRLGELGIPITNRVVWKNGAQSIYFDDPAGNVLEFATEDLWRQRGA